MHTATKSTTILPTVPLARDRGGRPLDVPSEASSWLIRRLTGGRPRNLSGPDRKPLRAPADFNEQDLENMLGPGEYRLDLCDATGKPLDVAVTINLNEGEGARTFDASSVAEIGAGLPAAVSDVRLVLEANVRATQMAFQHNERTLSASLRMADTLRDGIRDLATAQAGWINTLASARGFFRNAGVVALPPAPTVSAEPGDDDDDHDNEEEMPEGGDWKAMLEPLIGIAVERAVTTFMGVKAKAPPSSSTQANGAPSVETVRPPLTLAGVLDWRKVEPKYERPVEASQRSPADVDKELAEKAFAVMKHLTPAEQARMVKVFPRAIQDPEALQLVNNLLGMTDDAAAVWLRGHLDEIEARFS